MSENVSPDGNGMGSRPNNDIAEDADVSEPTSCPYGGLDTDQLIRAMEAVALLAPLIGGTPAAKAELADRLRDGRISAYSPRAWNSKRRDVLQAWREKPDFSDAKYDVELEIQVHPSVWRRSIHWAEDQDTWRWPSGRFSVLHRDEGAITRVMIENVHFDREEIERLNAELGSGAGVDFRSLPREDMDDEASASGQLPKGANVSNHRTRAKAWAAITLELIRLLQTREIDRPEFKLKKGLTTHLSRRLGGPDRLSDETLDYGTIDPMVGVVHPVLRGTDRFDRLPHHNFRPPTGEDG